VASEEDEDVEKLLQSMKCKFSTKDGLIYSLLQTNTVEYLMPGSPAELESGDPEIKSPVKPSKEVNLLLYFQMLYLRR
jgi:hypothetical protein